MMFLHIGIWGWGGCLIVRGEQQYLEGLRGHTAFPFLIQVSPADAYSSAFKERSVQVFLQIESFARQAFKTVSGHNGGSLTKVWLVFVIKFGAGARFSFE